MWHLLIIVLLACGVDEAVAGRRSGALGANLCRFINELTPGQVKFCEVHWRMIYTMGDGGKVAITECQQRFKYQRFNCTAAQGVNNPLDINLRLNTGTPEAAYVQAIRAAGMAWQVAAECESGNLPNCGCDDLTNNTKHLYGCPQAIHLAQAAVYRIVTADTYYTGAAKRNMDMHNTRAALQVVGAHVKERCECGDNTSSASCSIPPCYLRLPSEFGEIADAIFIKYKNAVHAQPNAASTNGHLIETQSGRRPHLHDFVYLAPSLTKQQFCRSYPTRGRECEIDGGVKSNGGLPCTELCCSGSSAPLEYTKVEECNCRHDNDFNGKCDMCKTNVTTTMCL